MSAVRSPAPTRRRADMHQPICRPPTACPRLPAGSVVPSPSSIHTTPRPPPLTWGSTDPSSGFRPAVADASLKWTSWAGARCLPSTPDGPWKSRWIWTCSLPAARIATSCSWKRTQPPSPTLELPSTRRCGWGPRRSRTATASPSSLANRPMTPTTTIPESPSRRVPATPPIASNTRPRPRTSPRWAAPACPVTARAGPGMKPPGPAREAAAPLSSRNPPGNMTAAAPPAPSPTSPPSQTLRRG